MEERKTVLTEKKLQIKYALLIGGFLAVLLFLAWGHIYYLVSTILPNILSSEMGEELKGVIRTLIKVGIVYVVGIVVLSIFLAHRLVGPINRIKKILLDIQKTGDFDKKFYIRKNDELAELFVILENTFQKLQENRLVYREKRQEICEKIKEIATQLKSNPNRKELLDELITIAEQLKHPGIPAK